MTEKQTKPESEKKKPAGKKSEVSEKDMEKAVGGFVGPGAKKPPGM